MPLESWGEKSVAPVPIRACFTPPRGCTDFIVKEIQSALKSIYVQAYSFTSLPIGRALMKAHERGVIVRIILDKSQKTDTHSRFHQFLANGIPVFIDQVSGIAHNKVMILDGEKVITGSFNFTQAAEKRNAENVILIDDKAIAALYLQNWYRRLAHSYAVNTEYYRSGKYFTTFVNDVVEYLKNLLIEYNLDKIL